MDVYLELGGHRVFAGAPEWPGWCRSGRDEDAALQALLAYGPRYAGALALASGAVASEFAFVPPAYPSDLTVVERLQGDATTDFGAPSMTPTSDHRPLDDAGIERQAALLRACWAALDAAAEAAVDKELRKGPRGGGRELDAIVRHVLEADAGYLRRLGRTLGRVDGEATVAELRRLRGEMLAAIASVARGEPVPNPRRSGSLWPPRYATRRVAWHALDHAWEIEDRAR